MSLPLWHQLKVSNLTCPSQWHLFFSSVSHFLITDRKISRVCCFAVFGEKAKKVSSESAFCSRLRQWSNAIVAESESIKRNACHTKFHICIKIHGKAKAAIRIKWSYFIWNKFAGYNSPYQRVVVCLTRLGCQVIQSRINEFGKYLLVISLACKSAAKGQL